MAQVHRCRKTSLSHPARRNLFYTTNSFLFHCLTLSIAGSLVSQTSLQRGGGTAITSGRITREAPLPFEGKQRRFLTARKPRRRAAFRATGFPASLQHSKSNVVADADPDPPDTIPLSLSSTIRHPLIVSCTVVGQFRRPLNCCHSHTCHP